MMNKNSLENRERVSALMDGQLRGAEFAQVVSLLGDDLDTRATWQAYHVVGEVLRAGEWAGSAPASGANSARTDDMDSAAFVARFRSRLQLDTRAVVAPVASLPVATDLIASHAYLAVTSGLKTSEKEVANDASFRWKLLAGVASLAAVAAISWSTLAHFNSPAAGPQLAQLPASLPATVAEEPQVMIRDPHLDALLAAHKQFGGTSALQMPAGFLRNATFEGPAR